MYTIKKYFLQNQLCKNVIHYSKFSTCFKLFRHNYNWRSHTCGELRKSDVGQKVTLCGWIQHNRSNKFVILRDWSGSVQIYNSLEHDIKNWSIESVVKIKGVVSARPAKDINMSMETGHIEVHAEELHLLNKCQRLPFLIIDQSNKLEEIRLQYRYLDIRTKVMQKNLRTRSNMIHKMRKFLIDKYDFAEIETPTLFRPTPGGAKEFVVSLSKNPNFCYTLPQSPQQFKQLLMVGGIDRYFQVARCYRDEDLKSDRQPEFTQLDIEMSFVDRKDVMSLTEELIRAVWPSQLPSNFPVIAFDDALESYGLDKPDTRYGMLLKDIGNQLGNIAEFTNKTVKAFVVPHRLTNKQLEAIRKETVKKVDESDLSRHGTLKIENGKIKPSGLAKLFDNDLLSSLPEILLADDNNTVFIAWGDLTDVNETLGNIRVITHNLLNKDEEIISMSKNCHEFLWVVDFPMFEIKDGIRHCTHHPFTAIHEDDIEHLGSCPDKVRSQAYDLVLNGQEVAGGSIRIHNSDLQQTILEKYLSTDPELFSCLLTALKSGAPPHGGIAVGLDRLLAILCEANSIRDVIAFPKSAKGKDIMSNSPVNINSDAFKHYKDN